MNLNQLNRRKITFRNKILIVCLSGVYLVGCNIKDKNTSHEPINNLTVEERKLKLFTAVKNYNFDRASTFVNVGIDTTDSFSVLMTAFYYFGVDSLEKSKEHFKRFGELDSLDCANRVITDFNRIIEDTALLPLGYERFFLKLYLQKLNYNNTKDICQFFSDSSDSTYTIEIDFNSNIE